MAPQAMVTKRYGKMLLSVKYNPCVVNSGMVYVGFKITPAVIITTIISSNAPNRICSSNDFINWKYGSNQEINENYCYADKYGYLSQVTN